MAESFLFAIATEVLMKIGSLAYQEVFLYWGLESDLRKLQKTMSAIHAVLLDAEKKQAKDNRLRLWLAELKDVFYDAEDVLDEFECEHLRKQMVRRGSTKRKVSRFFSSSNPLAFRFKIGHKIKCVRERLDEIAVEKSQFGLTECVEVRHVFPRERMMIHSFVSESDIVGRDGDKENIINFLIQPSKSDAAGNISLIPIVGLGGMGKTTLAKMVYNDKMVDGHFDLKLWVCVSEDFDLNRLMKEIISSATGDNCSMLAVDQLQVRLRNTLDGRKFLLILDDVWNENLVKWTELRELLIGGARGSKIVVTTRSHRVASIMGTANAYVLDGLPCKDCLSLLLKWAFRDGDEKRYPKLIKIGNEIVKKCGGVPLAVRTLGSLLYLKTDERDWLSIKDNDIWRLEQSENDILPVLKLSYDYLPSHLQRCFAYCSLFPKDYVFESDDLYCQWMAHGFLVTTNENEELEDVGLRYLKELMSRCFFQDIEYHGFYYRFKMHDLMHDLATSVAQEECSVVNFGIENVGKKARHLSLTDAEFNDQQARGCLINTSSIRTIMLPRLGEGSVYASNFNTGIISKFKCLRLLDLHNLLFKVLPDSICTLKHLRSLNLSGNRELEELPESVCELQNLQTLRLLGCTALKKLPDNLQNLISLRYLDITMRTTGCILNNGLGCLSSLRYLWVGQSDNLESLLEGIQSLTALRTLGIQSCSNLNSLPRSIGYLTKLENLAIVGCGNLNLKMELEGDPLRLSLRTFEAYALNSLIDLPQLILEGSVETLQHMRIRNCPNLLALPEWFQNLTSLETLEIKKCPALSSLPEGMERLTALRELRIQGSPALSESCKQDLSRIAHIPEIRFEDE